MPALSARRALTPTLVVLLAASGVSLAGCASPARIARASSSTSQSAVTFVNNTRTPIHYVYVSSCASDRWGPDQPGSHVVRPGRTWRFTMRPGCYDLKAIDRDGREAIERRVQVSGSGTRWTLR